MPKISIIIPVHNIEPYILECLESISAQTFQDYEVLIMENCSSDKTYEIAQQYAQTDKRFRTIKLDIKGPGNARNEGIKNASGEYISIIDGDDRISADFYESLVTAIEADQEIDMVIAEFYAFSGTEEPKLCSIGCPAGVYQKDDKKRIFSLRSACARLFKKKIIDKHHMLFKADLFMGEDFLFSLEYLVLCRKIAILDKGNYYYRVNRANSLSTLVYSFAKVSNMLDALDCMEAMLKKHGVYENYKIYMDREKTQVILGYSLGMGILRELTAKEVGTLLEPRKSSILAIRLDKSLTSSGFRAELGFFQFLLKHNIYRYYFKKGIRIFRNLFLQPLRIKLR